MRNDWTTFVIAAAAVAVAAGCNGGGAGALSAGGAGGGATGGGAACGTPGGFLFHVHAPDKFFTSDNGWEGGSTHACFGLSVCRDLLDPPVASNGDQRVDLIQKAPMTTSVNLGLDAMLELAITDPSQAPLSPGEYHWQVTQSYSCGSGQDLTWALATAFAGTACFVDAPTLAIGTFSVQCNEPPPDIDALLAWSQ